MKVQIPILKQELKDNQLINTESTAVFDLDTSVYSEERWEQNFPLLAAHEGLFQYIERVQQNALTEKVKVVSMLKAIFCFIESDSITSYKDFAKMFSLSVPEYTTKLIESLTNSFKIILGASSVKN